MKVDLKAINLRTGGESTITFDSANSLKDIEILGYQWIRSTLSNPHLLVIGETGQWNDFEYQVQAIHSPLFNVGVRYSRKFGLAPAHLTIDSMRQIDEKWIYLVTHLEGRQQAMLSEAEAKLYLTRTVRMWEILETFPESQRRSL